MFHAERAARSQSPTMKFVSTAGSTMNKMIAITTPTTIVMPISLLVSCSSSVSPAQRCRDLERLHRERERLDHRNAAAHDRPAHPAALSLPEARSCSSDVDLPRTGSAPQQPSCSLPRIMMPSRTAWPPMWVCLIGPPGGGILAVVVSHVWGLRVGVATGHLAFSAGASAARRARVHEDVGSRGFGKFEHRQSEVSNLPLSALAAAQLEEVQQFADVHGHDDLGLHGVGQQVARIFGGSTPLSISARYAEKAAAFAALNRLRASGSEATAGGQMKRGSSA